MTTQLDLPPEYVLPNNPQESERLDFQHVLLTRTFKGLHRAPLNPTKVRRVLDIGCGTGNWAIDFARQYPEAQVVGLDIQEKGDWTKAPSNCSFKVADLDDEEAWSSLGEFDYIHGRFIVVAVRDWTALLRRSFAHLSPGGSVEIQDLFMPCGCGDQADVARSKIVEWSRLMIEGGKKVGLDPQVMEKLPGMLKDAGFEDVSKEDYRMLTGPWVEDDESRVLGRMGQQNIATGLHGFGYTLFTRVLGWSNDDYEKFVESGIRELKEDGLRTWLPVKVCFAQRSK